MKKNFTKIALSFAALVMITATKSYAATITATVSGNWSNASTWSGGAPGATVSLDNIIIPAGITVTLDMDVQVTSILGSISVSGDLNSINTKKLMINQGALSGNGNMNLYYLELGTIGGMSFTGGLTVNQFITSNASLNLGSQVTLVDTLYLKAGSLTLGSGSLLSLNTGSNIKVEDGSIAIGGGVLAGTNDYDVLYVGNSKTTGIELNGTGLTHFYVQLSSATQSLTLGGSTIVKGTLYHTLGTLILGANDLTLKDNYLSQNSSLTVGSTTSNLMIMFPTTPTSSFRFATGAQVLNNLSVNIASGTNVNTATDLSINGTLTLVKGYLSVANNSTLTMNAGSAITVNTGSLGLQPGSGFNGTASYDVNYTGPSKMAYIELSGSGLHNVNLNLTNNTDSVKMIGNTTIKGTLMLDKGSFNIGSNLLEIQGNLTSTTKGWLQGNQSSDLFINTTTGVSDTVKFSTGRNSIHSFSVNTGNGSNVMLDFDLTVENLNLVNGGVIIYQYDLTINPTGSIIGYDMNKYISIKGLGQLMMNVNTASPFVIFPIGTINGYGPAYIQRTTGASAMLGAGTFDGVYLLGTTGTNMAILLSVVDRTWNITSASTSSVNLNVKLEWITPNEVNGFNRANAYISQYTNNWDMVTPSASTVTGTGTYQMLRNGITTPGLFSVADNMSALSVKEQTDITFSVYPNPTFNHLTIMLNDNNGFSVEVIDVLGNKAIAEKTIKSSSTTDVDFSSLSAGVYFVKISNGKTQSIKRVVKQ